MRQLFLDAVGWDDIHKIEGRTMDFEIQKCVLNRESGNLKVPVRLNFVIPYLDAERIKALIINRMSVVKTVEIEQQYCAAEDMAIPEAEIVRLQAPYSIDKVDSALKCMVGDYRQLRIEYDKVKNDKEENELKIRIYVMSAFACEQLNEQAAPSISADLKALFGIDAHVDFEADTERYEAQKMAFEQSEAEDIRRCMEERAAEAAKRAAASSGGSGSGGNGTSSGSRGGNSAGGNFGKWADGGTGGNFGNGSKGGNGGWKGSRRKKDKPAEGNKIMGGEIKGGKTVELGDIAPEQGDVIVEGVLFKKDARCTKSGSYLVSLMITDNKTTICTKGFMSDTKWKEIDELLTQGDGIKLEGEVQFDTFENMNTIMYSKIEKLDKLPDREDTYEGGRRVELHAHTKMSAMDGLNEPADIVRRAAFWGQPAVAITDHGVVQAFPDAAKEAKKQKAGGKDIKIIYGMEGYVFDDADCKLPDGTIDFKKKNTNHIILLAKTQEGLRNIYKLVSFSHLNYFYKRPRLPKSVIEQYREGVIIGAACEAGEVFQSVLNGEPESEQERKARFYDYLEVQPIINNQFLIDNGTVADEDGLRELNKKVIALGDRLGIPVVATTDAHYDKAESAIYRNIIMAGQGYKDAENGRGLYLRTTDEMMEEFSYLGEEKAREIVIENTNRIAEAVGDILPVPKGKFPPKITGAEDTLRITCMEKAYSLYGNPLPDRIAERLEKELNSIIDNGYAVMYVSAQMLVQKSLEDGYLVGSRGSVGSSLAATMAGITEVNPLEPHYICPECKYLEWGDMELYDCGVDMPEKQCPKCGAALNRDGYTIPFATFLGFDGDKEPDIDLNFAGEYQATAHKYVGTIFGEGNVYKAGTVGTVADKTAYGYVRKFFDELKKPINKYEAERLTQNCTGVKRTTGQHPGGIIIVPEDHEIYEFCPVQHPANDVNSDIITTHFDYHKIDENLLKLDILGHNVPSMIRQLQDMTGVDPLTVSLTDKNVLSIFNGVEALEIKDPDYKFVHGSYAIPEFGTPFVRQMLDDTTPDKFADLVRISGFSHGTDVWRNNAQDYIRSGVATMREVISTRDDIMNYLILKGIENKTSFKIMEDVRKNRPLSDEQLKVMKDHGVPDWYVDSCIKIQYMFPRAHAVAYVMMSFRMAWYKVYYPVEFYATHFTSVTASFDAETILKGQVAVWNKIEEIRAKVKDGSATPKESDDLLVLEVAYEMYARGYEFMAPRLGLSDATKFGKCEGKVLLPLVAIGGVGETVAKAIADEYKIKPFDTVEEATNRAKINKTAMEGLKQYNIFDGLQETDQYSMFSF